MFAAICGAIVLLAGSASADNQGPIDFESYSVGDINGQYGWSKTGPYDVAVVDATAYGFAGNALRLSNAVVSGSFGDQTFSPGLTEPAGEAAKTHFEASFKIGTTSAAEQPGLFMSVSPDDGNGSRMSYLRFEDQSDGVHVFFDDATFVDHDVTTLDRTQAHTVKFDIGFRTNAPDVVDVYIDGALKHTGTTWEDYYRSDPEQAANGNQVPLVSKLLFREGGSTNNPDVAGGGFLVDDVSLNSSSSPVCAPTGFDGLTAAQIGGDLTGTLDATGCDIGIYYEDGATGDVSGADIFGAQSYGVVVNGVPADVSDSSIHDIGDNPFDGVQRGIGVAYENGAKGTLSGNTITRYQKGGVVIKGDDTAVTVQDNTVTGAGPIDYIAQNGIQVSYGASASVIGNTVSGNWYTPRDWTACGLLIYQANGVKQKANNLFGNEIDLCNVGRGGGHYNP